MARRFVLVLMAAFIHVAPAWNAAAATIQAVTLAGDKPAIFLGGAIVPGDEVAFHKLAQTLVNPIVMVTGPGGRVAPAIAIGVEVRDLGLSTLVPPGGSCASACTFIWLAGVHRLLGGEARIGFHAMSMPGAGGAAETHAADYALRSYLLDLGYALDTTATIVNTPSAMVRWLDAGELTANGIDNEPYP